MARPPTCHLLVILLLLTAPTPVLGQLQSFRVTDGFANPVYATSAPGYPGQLFVAEYGGRIRVLDTATGTINPTPLLDLAAVSGANFLNTGNQQGLFGLAFHPNFQSNGYLYVDYTFNNGNPAGATRVERYSYNFATGTASPASRQTILEIPQIAAYHNGGWLGFSPTNGLLHINVGDGDGRGNDPGNNAQSKSTLLGKVLRIDVNTTSPGLNYSIPASNPFVNTPGARGEILAYGLRNPWRSSFDSANGNLYIGDVGQAHREEIDFIANGTGGQNFGWRLREGNIPNPLHGVGGRSPPDHVGPIIDYPHGADASPSGGASVTGGYVYRGGLILEEGQPLDGTYFYGDFISGRVWSLRYNGEIVYDHRERTADLRDAVNGGRLDNLVSFAEDGFGQLYLIDFDGEVFRVAQAVPEPGTLALVGTAAVGFWLRRRRTVTNR
jgi:glucose/arabinose dehydrogenase